MSPVQNLVIHGLLLALFNMQLGIIEDGKLINRKIILDPREGLKQNEWLIEKTVKCNQFSLHCLVCEQEIPMNGCPHCDK